MSAPKAKGKPFSLERYRAEAKGEPFTLFIDDNNTIVISRPTGDQMFDAEEAMRTGTSRDVIVAIAGDQADALFEALGSEDAAVFLAVVEDMQKHFGLGN